MPLEQMQHAHMPWDVVSTADTRACGGRQYHTNGGMPTLDMFCQVAMDVTAVLKHAHARNLVHLE